MCTHEHAQTHTPKGRQRREGFLVGDRKPPECLLGPWAWGGPHDECIWPSLIGPDLDLGTKFREAVIYSSGPGHLRQIVMEVIV